MKAMWEGTTTYFSADNQIMLFPIHIPSGSAWIMGEDNHFFRGMTDLLIHLGCTVESMRPEEHKADGCVVVHSMYKVVFPIGAKVIRLPKEGGSDRTASGRLRKKDGKPIRRDLTLSLSDRKGHIVVPGSDCDYVVTWYCRTKYSPQLFDRGVLEVEKD